MNNNSEILLERDIKGMKSSCTKHVHITLIHNDFDRISSVVSLSKRNTALTEMESTPAARVSGNEKSF